MICQGWKSKSSMAGGAGRRVVRERWQQVGAACVLGLAAETVEESRSSEGQWAASFLPYTYKQVREGGDLDTPASPCKILLLDSFHLLPPAPPLGPTSVLSPSPALLPTSQGWTGAKWCSVDVQKLPGPGLSFFHRGSPRTQLS